MNDRRQVPRYLCDLKGELIDAGSGTRVPVSIAVLSTRGGAVEDSSALQVKQKYQFLLGWEGWTIQIEVEVVWKNREGLAGLKFLSVDEKDMGMLRELLASLRIQPATKPQE